jgi:hypothetical protein
MRAREAGISQAQIHVCKPAATHVSLLSLLCDIRTSNPSAAIETCGGRRAWLETEHCLFP